MRLNYGTLAAALGLVALTAAPAAAQAKPVITEVKYSDGNRVTTVPVGGTIYIDGRELFQPKELERDPKTGRIKPGQKPFADLTVRIGGKECMVFASTLQRITVQVHPSVAPSKRTKIEVRVRGRGSAETSIAVVSMKEWKESSAGERESGGESSGGRSESSENAVIGGFQITKFSMVSGGAGQTFQVEGTAKNVPDDLRAQLTLLYANRQIRSRAVPIKDGKFVCTFGPYTEKLLVGNYGVELLFALNKQSRIKLKQWLRKLKKDEVALYKRIVRRGYTSVGGTGPNGQILPEDRAKQQEELKQHCIELTSGCEKLMEKLKLAYGGAARSFFKKPGSASYDETEYKAWLVKIGFASDEDSAGKIIRDTTYGSRGGHFQDNAWESFATDTLIPGLQDIYDRHEKFNKQYIAPPDGRAEKLGHYLISNVCKLFQKWSGNLYSKSKLRMPQTITSMPFPVISAPRTSMQYFEAKRRELLRQVGAAVADKVEAD